MCSLLFYKFTNQQYTLPYISFHLSAQVSGLVRKFDSSVLYLCMCQCQYLIDRHLFIFTAVCYHICALFSMRYLTCDVYFAVLTFLVCDALLFLDHFCLDIACTCPVVILF